MKFPFFQFPVLLACVVLGGAAHAERADRAKPMNVESDTLRYDDVKQTSVFTGKVLVTKGTIVMRGAQLDVRQDPEGNQYGVMTAEPGKLAFFRQKRETKPGVPDEFMEGEGEVIEYDGKGDIVKFHRRAQMRRYIGAALNDEMTGVEIVYDNTTSILTVDGGAAPKPGPDGAAPRVRTMLTPRIDESRPGSPAAAASAAAAAAPAPVLRSSPAIGGTKK